MVARDAEAYICVYAYIYIYIHMHLRTRIHTCIHITSLVWPRACQFLNSCSHDLWVLTYVQL